MASLTSFHLLLLFQEKLRKQEQIRLEKELKAHKAQEVDIENNTKQYHDVVMMILMIA